MEEYPRNLTEFEALFDTDAERTWAACAGLTVSDVRAVEVGSLGQSGACCYSASAVDTKPR